MTARVIAGSLGWYVADPCQECPCGQVFLLGPIYGPADFAHAVAEECDARWAAMHEAMVRVLRSPFRYDPDFDVGAWAESHGLEP
jgi:hypothetical protein